MSRQQAYVIEEVLMELEGLEDSPTHTPDAVCESDLVSGGHFVVLKDLFEENLIDWFGEVIPNTPKSSLPAQPPSHTSSNSLFLSPAFTHVL